MNDLFYRVHFVEPCVTFRIIMHIPDLVKILEVCSSSWSKGAWSVKEGLPLCGIKLLKARETPGWLPPPPLISRLINRLSLTTFFFSSSYLYNNLKLNQNWFMVLCGSNRNLDFKNNKIWVYGISLNLETLSLLVCDLSNASLTVHSSYTYTVVVLRPGDLLYWATEWKLRHDE